VSENLSQNIIEHETKLNFLVNFKSQHIILIRYQYRKKKIEL